MVLRGHVKGNTVVLDDDFEMPEGASVDVVIHPPTAAPVASVERPVIPKFSVPLDAPTITPEMVREALDD